MYPCAVQMRAGAMPMSVTVTEAEAGRISAVAMYTIPSSSTEARGVAEAAAIGRKGREPRPFAVAAVPALPPRAAAACGPGVADDVV